MGTYRKQSASFLLFLKNRPDSGWYDVTTKKSRGMACFGGFPGLRLSKRGEATSSCHSPLIRGGIVMKRHADPAIRVKPADSCSACGEPAIHFPTFDALACLACNVWLEPACRDPACPLCYRRPSTPSEARERGQFCKFCGTAAEICPEYDAMYCPTCDIWVEQRCGDPFCEFCTDHPPRPSRVNGLLDCPEIRPPQ